MNILVVNSGSSSLKYQLFDMSKGEMLAKGGVEKIGLPGSLITQTVGDKKTPLEIDIPDHSVAINLMIQMLTDAENGVIKSLDEINAVGHRMVHGGSFFTESVELTDDVIKTVEDLADLAPLHNPPTVLGVKACKEAMPGVTHVGVFDTAFHQTMPAKSYLYPIGYEMYEKHSVRRYGFHGTSHRYVYGRLTELLENAETAKIVTCHLGNGSSLSAIMGGKVVDTTMGFTPLAGLMMGTRSGDVDPAIIPYIMEKEGMDVNEAVNYLNKKSGLMGVSGVSSDMRDLYAAIEAGNEKAKLAVEMCQHAAIKYVGAYVAEMNGVDAIVFTAGIGENDGDFRAAVCKNLEYLGVEIDTELNGKRGQEIMISTPNSKVKVFVIPTNEELMIATDTLAIVNAK